MRTADETADDAPERGVVIDLKSYRKRSRRARQVPEERDAKRAGAAGTPTPTGRGLQQAAHQAATAPQVSHRRSSAAAAELVAEHLDPGPRAEQRPGSASPRQAPARPIWAFLFWATLVLIWGAAIWLRRH